MAKNITELIPEDSWFARWMQCFPLAEPPKSFVLFAAMSTLGACIGRDVWFDQDVHTLYPMINLLLIGPSGIGKSTSLVHMSQHLLKTLAPELRPQVIAGKATMEKLHVDLVAQPHSIIVASELANFFSREKYMEGMIPYITQLLDYEDEVSVRTKSGSLTTIKRPAVTIQGGSTVEWLQEQLPSTATAGGFLPRFLILKEDYKSQRVPNPRRAMSTIDLKKLEQFRYETFAQFPQIVTMYQGPMDYDNYEASDAYGIWYQCQQPATGHLSPFAARAGEFVLRMSMLLALSRFHTKIETADVETSIALYNYCAKKLQEVVVPYTIAGRMMALVLQAVGNETVGDVQLKRAMRNYCSAQDVERMLRSLIDSGDLKQVEEGKYRRL